MFRRLWGGVEQTSGTCDGGPDNQPAREQKGPDMPHTPAMPQAMQGQQDSLDIVVRGYVAYLVCSVALFTLCYHGALVLDWTFQTLSLVSGGLIAFFSLGWLVWMRRGLRGASRNTNSRAAWLLATLALACALLALFAVKPNADDTIYLANPLWDFENPAHPITGYYPFAFIEPQARLSILSLQANAMFCSVAASWLHVQPQDVYYFLLPSLAGLALPCVWYLLLRLFSENRAAVLAGVACVVLVLCLDGATHRAPGSFALVRIWQGKVILKALLTPFALWAMLRMLCAGGLFNGVLVFATGVAALGMSIVSAFYFPFLAALACGSHWLIFPRTAPLGRRILTPLLLVLYPVGLMLPQYLLIKNALSQLPSEKSWPVTLETLVEFVYGWPSPTLVAFGLGLTLLLVLKRFRLAAWTGLWAGVVLVGLLIPGMGKWVAENLTSHDTLWRIFYTLPFLLVAGLGVLALYERVSGSRPWSYAIWSGLGALLCLVASLAFVPGSISPFNPSDTAFAFPPRHKLPPNEVAIGRMVAGSDLPGGSMFAALPVSRTLPLLTSRFRQGELRSGFIMLPLTIFAGDIDKGLGRMAAHRFVGGQQLDATGKQALRKELENPYDYLVLHKSALEYPGVEHLLREKGYAPCMELPEALTLWRRGA